MTTNEIKQAWSIWINQSDKIITVKNRPAEKKYSLKAVRLV